MAAPPPDPHRTAGDDPGSALVDVGPIGGQALLEGVMMRRSGAWGAAVRRSDGSISTVVTPLPHDGGAARSIPFVRGPVALWDSVSLGVRAMLWGARERGTADGRGYSKVGLVLTSLFAALLAVGMLGVLPAVVPKVVGIEGRYAFNATEGVVRLLVLVGYMWLLSLSPEVKRTFGYHGAEHMTIHAFEHGVELVPGEIRRFDRRHPRCGTAFLLIVVLVSVVAHVAVGEVSWVALLLTRILGLPVIAAVAYEIIRFAGQHRHTAVGRFLMLPGSWLQSLTTQPPDDDQIEVAVAALRATLSLDPAASPVTAPAVSAAGA